MKKIFIIGAGGLAKEITFLIEEINTNIKQKWSISGIIDKQFNDIKQFNGKYPIVGDENFLIQLKEDVSVAFGVGSPLLLKKIYNRLLKHKHIHFPNLIHPNVIMDSKQVKMGEGNIICAGNILTTGITIGNCNIINLSCTIGHDVSIADCCVINPGSNISGGVIINSGSLIGTGAVVLQYIEIGKNTTVGAGAVVTKNISERITVVGNPARPLVKKYENKKQ